MSPTSGPSPGQLKVMISSTSFDLPAHRKAAMDAVLRAGCFPLDMEHGTATSNSDAIRFSLDMVDQADLYVGIFAQRYGFIPDNKKENPQGWSVTEHEYRRAKKQAIPRLIYLADKDHKFSEDDFDFEPEKRAKLKALKEELRAHEICAFFPAPDKLNALIVQSLFEDKMKRGHAPAAESQAPAPIPHPPELYTVPPYTLTNEFVGRRAELVTLDTWAASPDPVIVVEAIGGMGKSALTWEWTLERAKPHIPGLAGRVWWSFYERGTSMHTFLRHALAYVTERDPETLRDLNTYDCGQQLLTELNRRPYLLVLDGFERVLTAYHHLDKAQMPDDQVPVDKRECVNPKDGEVLRQLVHCGPSKVLVSSRLMPRALEDRHTHKPIPGVHHLELEGLAPADALDMVRRSGVQGKSAAILDFVDQFDQHALVLRIVCGMITDYRPKPGDFNAWRADPYAGGGLKLSELPLKQRYTHIMEFAFRGLAEKTRQLLSRIAVLSDGADYATIAVLNPFLPPRPEEVQGPEDSLEGFDKWIQHRLNQATSPKDREEIEAEKFAFHTEHERKYREQKEAYERYQEALRVYFVSAEYYKALSDFHSALGDLEDRGLLQWDREANTYDLHPVVRAFSFEQLEERDRTGAFDAVSDHFASLPPENAEEATELVHVKNSIEIMRALIGAGRLQKAFAFYRGSLADSLMFSIGAYSRITELLSPWLKYGRDSAPVIYDQSDISYVINDAAIALSFMGRDEEAIQLYRVKLRLDLNSGDSGKVATGLGNLGISFQQTNRLAASAICFQMRYDLSAISGTEDALSGAFLRLMTHETIIGQFEKAEDHLSSFRNRHQPIFAIYRPGDAEFQHAVSRFWQGRLTAEDLDQADRVSADGRNLFGKHRLAALRAEWELTRGNPTIALEAIEQAVAITRRTGEPAPHYLGLRALALARLGQISEARETLAEAEETWSGRLPDFPLFAAETWLTLGDCEEAREYIRRAYPLAWADGPPYIRWYDLKRCRELMAELGEPEPQLPPFDPAKVDPIPHEAEIRAIIEELKAEAAKEQADHAEDDGAASVDEANRD
jgi:tetratricopeptide (TPR) repeat protein